MTPIHLLIGERLELNVAVAVLGGLILVLGLLRNFFNTKFPASTIMVALGVGIILGPKVLNLINPSTWGGELVIIEEVARLVIAVQLMAIALGISFHYLVKAWKTQLTLVILGVALMWGTAGFIIYGFFKIDGGYDFSIWQALLIGACIAPTDPIVASAVADSALAIRLVPARVRHTITAESGLNDGGGAPFVMLCLRFVLMNVRGDTVGRVFLDWVVQDILWGILVGIILGIVLGFCIGKLLVWAEPKKLHDQQLLVALTVALAFGFMGGGTLLGVNGFLVVSVGGVVYARVVEGDKRGAESQLQETVDLIFSTVVFLLFGLVIPFDSWHLIGWWRGILVAICIVLFRRIPWMFALRPLMTRQIWSVEDTLFLGYFGPIGVGAIFYALHASAEIGDDYVWVVVSLLVFTQVVVFGITDTTLILWYGSTNPHYIRRRRQKHRAMEQAAAEIQHIQDNLATQLHELPTSPTLPATASGQSVDSPARNTSRRPSLFHPEEDDDADPPAPVALDTFTPPPDAPVPPGDGCV